MLQSNLKLYVCCILFQFFLLFFCNTLIYKDIYPSSTVQSYARQLILLITRTDGPNADCSVENMSPAMTLYNVPKKKGIFFSLRSGFRVVMSIFDSSVHPVVCRWTLFYVICVCLGIAVSNTYMNNMAGVL